MTGEPGEFGELRFWANPRWDLIEDPIRKDAFHISLIVAHPSTGGLVRIGPLAAVSKADAAHLHAELILRANAAIPKNERD